MLNDMESVQEYVQYVAKQVMNEALWNSQVLLRSS